MYKKQRTGYLFRQDSAFHIQWREAGRIFSQVLTDGRGKPITNLPEAEEARVKFLATPALAPGVGVS